MKLLAQGPDVPKLVDRTVVDMQTKYWAELGRVIAKGGQGNVLASTRRDEDKSDIIRQRRLMAVYWLSSQKTPGTTNLFGSFVSVGANSYHGKQHPLHTSDVETGVRLLNRMLDPPT